MNAKLANTLRNQAFALNLLADQIENNEPITVDWMIQFDMTEFKAEIAAMESQQELNHEIEKDVA